MQTKRSLNESTYQYILKLGDKTNIGQVVVISDLVELFKKSDFFLDDFDEISLKSFPKSIWWALIRTNQWEQIGNGKYKKKPDDNRVDFIKFLSQSLFKVIMLKADINDETLKNHYLSSKGIGDDLYYLTESYYRKKGIFKGKHSISDFVSKEAKLILDSGVPIRNRLRFEHMVPKHTYIERFKNSLRDGTLTEDFIFQTLREYYFVCTVTTEEDKLLPRKKTDIKLYEKDPYLRYTQAKIEFEKNIFDA